MGLKTEMVEKRNELDAKRKKLAEVFAQAGPDVDLTRVDMLEGDTSAKAATIRTMHTEINELSTEVDGMVETLKAAGAFEEQEERRERAGFKHDGGERETKARESELMDLGALFVKGFKGKAIEKDTPVEIDIDWKGIKTLMTTSAGWAPETTRSRPLLDFVTRPIQVTDVIPTGTTDQVALKYMEETTFTNNAAEVAEGGTKPESALALTERTEPVRKIATWIPVTDEQLEDVAGIQTYINNRLMFMVRQRLDSQILVGDGIAPNLLGLLNRSGLQTQAKGTDPVPDAIYKAMVKVRLTGAGNGGGIPNVAFFNPLDWQDVRLLRTADGIYIWGSPADPGIDRIWGLPVVLAEGLTVDTAIVGDTTFMELAIKQGIQMAVSNSHSTYFVENKQAIRCEMRAALAVYRPAAFCKVTGV